MASLIRIVAVYWHKSSTRIAAEDNDGNLYWLRRNNAHPGPIKAHELVAHKIARASLELMPDSYGHLYRTRRPIRSLGKVSL